MTLPLTPPKWMAELAQRYVLTELPVDSALCFAALGLPAPHRDPFDRFIIAGALRLKCAVVTVDPMFSAYGVEIIA